MTAKSAKHIRSIAGAVMLGVGAFLLRENLNEAAQQLHHVLGLGDGPGLLTSLTLAAARSWQAYAANHLQFLHDCLLQLLTSCRPLLLIVGGAFMSRNMYPGSCGTLHEADCGNVELPR